MPLIICSAVLLPFALSNRESEDGKKDALLATILLTAQRRRRRRLRLRSEQGRYHHVWNISQRSERKRLVCAIIIGQRDDYRVSQFV